MVFELPKESHGDGVKGFVKVCALTLAGSLKVNQFSSFGMLFLTKQDGDEELLDLLGLQGGLSMNNSCLLMVGPLNFKKHDL